MPHFSSVRAFVHLCFDCRRLNDRHLAESRNSLSLSRNFPFSSILLRTLSFLFFCLLPFSVLAQSVGSGPERLSGTVVDTTGAPVDLATVMLYKYSDKSTITGATTDAEGHFVLKNLPQEECMLIVSKMGYERYLQRMTLSGSAEVVLPPIELKIDIKEIESITVSTRFLERRADRYLVNMVGNPLGRNRSISGVLSLLPGITNYEGLRINGRKGTVVYINGREVRDLRELSNLQGTDVQKIEVIPTAGSEFDASLKGGIIKITLRKLAEGGLLATFGSSANASGEGFLGGNVYSTVNWRTKRFSLYNYLYYQDDYGSLREFTTAHYDNLGFDREINRKEGGRQSNFGNNLNVVYDLNENHSVGANIAFGLIDVDANWWSWTSDRPSGQAEFNRINYFDESHRAYNNSIQGAVNYLWNIDEKGSNFLFVADYRYSDGGRRGQNRREYTLPVLSPDLQNFWIANGWNRFTADAKFEFRLGEASQLDFGARYYQSREANDYSFHDQVNGEWVIDSVLSDDFTYYKQGYGLYSNFSSTVGKFSYNAGVRIQTDRLKHVSDKLSAMVDKWYWGVYPTVGVGWLFDADKGNALNLTYKRAITLPHSAYLMPNRVYFSDGSYNQGNPSLKPSTADMVQLSYALHNKWFFTYNFTATHNDIYRLTFLDASDPTVTYVMPQNYGWAFVHQLVMSTSLKPFKWWRTNSSLMLFYEKVRYGTILYDQWYVDFNFSNGFTFKKGWGANLNFWTLSRCREGNDFYSGRYYLTIGAYKTFLKNRLFVSLSVNNIAFHHVDTGIRLPEDGYTSYTQDRTRLRTVVLTLRYTIKRGYKTQVRKVQTLGSEDDARKP